MFSKKEDLREEAVIGERIRIWWWILLIDREGKKKFLLTTEADNWDEQNLFPKGNNT